MTRPSVFEIAVLPGDGIGVEVTAAALEVLEALLREIGGLRFRLAALPRWRRGLPRPRGCAFR